MPAGYYVVSANQPQRDVRVERVRGMEGDPPRDQMSLVIEIEATSRVLRQLFEGQDAEFAQFFDPLVSLAQAGLVGEQAHPEIATLALAELRREILSREAGRVKNRHMRALGRAAIWLAAPCLVVAVMARTVGHDASLASSPGVMHAETVLAIALLLSGCAAGVWVSFGARKAIMTFEDLTVPEADFLHAGTRVCFAAVLTLFLGLLFHARAAEVTLGKLSTAAVLQDPVTAVVVGFLAGFSEQVLSKTIATHASKLLGTAAT